ncbi:MAG: aldo/keto reductase [Chitinispirillales bacterium]|jgi:aryl-alcohol dehydrogenase-like predicted oxidoreductase|nr:aldo/keto reductase [Chitinispirillales bacterium]
MKKQKLGNSDLEITRVGIGAWAIGGSWQWGWGHQNDDDSIAAIRRAVDLGVNWIDTAPVYGLGHSETIVGKAIKGMKDKPYIFTKCGLRWDERNNDKREARSCLKAASVRKEAEDSLKRLGVDAIDLYQIHWPNPNGDIEEAWTEMVKLQEEGKVRWIGVSNHSVKQMDRLMKIAPITSLQPPYNYINRTIEAITLPYCQDNNIGVIVYSPMASGLLTGRMTAERIAAMPNDDWRKYDFNFTEPQLSRNLKIVKVMASIAEARGVPTPQIPIAWALKHPAVTAAIVGKRKPAHAEEAIGAADLVVSDEEWAKIPCFSWPHH